MPSYRAVVDVSAPAAEVWPLVSDLTRHSEWAADEVSVTPAEGGAGERFTSTATAKGREFRADLAVSVVEPPRRFVFSATDSTGSWQHEFTLSEVPGGTRVTRTMTGQLSKGQAALFWLVLLPVKKPSAQRSLERLKQAVESTHQS